MARLNIDVGTAGNPATGDTLRTAMIKINTNFSELYGTNVADGVLTTTTTNGDVRIQPNGTGIVEVDQLQVNGDAITSIVTNGSVDITGNGTGGVNIEALTFNGTSISSSDSSRINLNENVTVDGDLVVTGSISGSFTVSSLDADSSTVSNLELDNFKASAIVTEAEGIGSNDNDTTLPTSAAVKDYVDARDIGDLSVTGSTIASPSNADLTLDPSGTGNVKILTDQITLGTGSSAGTEAVAIGKNTNAGNYAQAIGNNAGNSGQGQGAVALGSEAGETDQGNKAVAIGNYAGETTQGANAIAIGEKAGQTSQAANSIVINATGAALNNTTASSMVVKPIRNASGTHQLEYNPTTGEVTYDTLASADTTGDLAITGSTISAPSNADLTLTTSGTGSVSVDGIQIKGTEISSSDSTQITIKENLHVTGNISGTITGTVSTLDADNTTVSNIEVDNFKASAIVTEAEGIGSNDNDTTIPTSAAVKDYVDNNAGGTTGDLAITGSTISAPSNADLTLNAGGTGSVDIEGIQIKGTEISSSDSTQVTIKENLHVTGTVSGTIDASGLSGALPAISGANLTGVAKHSFRTINVTGVDGVVADSASDELTIVQGNNVTIAVDTVNDRLTFNVDGMGDLTFAGSTIISPSNADITLSPGGTGAVAMPGITINDNKITSNRSNDNLEIEANGTGTVVLENLKVGTGATVTTILDEDNMSTNSATALATQQSIKAYVDSEISGVSGGSTGDLTITGSTISSPSNAPLTLDPSGSGKVTAVGGLVVSGGDTETADITSSGQIDAVGFTSTGNSTFDGVQITDNKVTSASSNADLELDASGTGGIIAQAPFTFNAGYIEKINALTSSSTITVNCALASIHTVTLGTSTEFNITNLPTGGSVTLIITQDGTGTRTATFGTDGSSAVKFPSNSSTLSTGGGDIDVVTIVNDGTNFLGNIAKDYRSS